LEPATRVGRNRDERRDADPGVHGIQKVGALAIEAIRHHILEREQPSCALACTIAAANCGLL
jgi:hypothetical protein